MSTIDRAQHAVENFSIFFQGGVRRKILFFLGICILLLAPFYYIGQFTAVGVRQLWIDDTLTINPKNFTFETPTIGATKKAFLANGQQDMYVEVDNKINRTIGFYPYEYSVQILDREGSLIKEEQRKEYILPEDIKLIAIRDESGRGETLNVLEKSGTTPINFNAAANPLQRTPDVEVTNQSVEEISGDRYQIKALLNNRDKQRIERIDITYFIRNRRQEVIGVGTGSFNGFTSGSNRSFEAIHPKSVDDEAALVEIRWSVNYLDENSLQFN